MYQVVVGEGKLGRGKLHLLQMLTALHVHLLHDGGDLDVLVVLQRLDDDLQDCCGEGPVLVACCRAPVSWAKCKH